MESESSKPLPPPPPMFSSTAQMTSDGIAVKPGNHDRGWNDPPVFGVAMNIGGKSIPTKLNKRVAFPLSTGGFRGEISSSNGNGNTIAFDSNIPPPPSFVPANVVYTPPNPPLASAVLTSDLTRVGALTNDLPLSFSKESVMMIFQNSFESISLEPKAKEEIKKRLDIFEGSWDSLPEEIKTKLGQLSQCLEEKNYGEAEQLQRILGSEFISHCSLWIMAIKNIIRAKQEQQL